MPGTAPDELTTLPVLDFPTFLRKFEQRAEGIMWLLGAGASRASGIKTAGDMIWDFKARLYRSAKRVPASSVSDLSDPRIRDTLQRYFDAQETFPPLNSEEEYSRYFEETYPSAQDRRRYIDELMRGAKPSFAHLALAHLMKLDHNRIVWTTNFDRVYEDAVNQVFGSSSILTVGDLGEPDRIRTAFSQQRWPIYAKLHGDFQSENLKNTTEELSSQDAAMRDVFLDSCRNLGLVVAGYSGRDQSVMDVLNDAINQGAGFPNGLFWCVREQDFVYDGVKELMAEAQNLGIDAHFVRSESFNELLSDIIRYLPATEELSIKLDEKRKIAPRKINLSKRAAKVPFVRTNAIPIVDYPKTCRLVDCEIGGAQEIQEVLESQNSALIASRVKRGMLVFGDDSEIKRVFSDHDIKSLDTHGILDDRLTFESGERSLLRDALLVALSTFSGFEIIRHRYRTIIRADHVDPTFDLEPLTTATGRLHGVLTEGNIAWSEACSLRVDFRMDTLWLLLNPIVRIDIDDDTPEPAVQVAKEFVRERRVKRYNKQSNAILNGWIKAIFGSGTQTVTLGVDGGTGIGARFEIMPVTAFSGLST